MNRRTFCKRALAGVAGATALSGTSAATDADFARVTTRGHLDVNWLGQTYLKDAYTKYEYETMGEIPGHHTGESPDEICVFVHGWLQDREDVNGRFPRQKAALQKAGFDGPVIVFDWDSGSPRAGWWIAAEYARRNGHKLGQFLKDYRERNPETTVRVVGFSLGAMVTAPAGQSLYDRGWDGEIDSMAFIGGAVGDQTVAVDGKYGPGCATVYGEVDNFYKTDDFTLSNQYKIAETNGAIGTEGIEGEPPENYEEHDVSYVTAHGNYWKYDEGCVREMVAEWKDDDSTLEGSDSATGGPVENASVESERFEGSLDGAGDGASHSLSLPGNAPATLDLAGPEDADFDLYATVDGREPSERDHDYRSRSLGADETLELTEREVGDGALTVLVHSYRGSGEYVLAVGATN